MIPTSSELVSDFKKNVIFERKNRFEFLKNFPEVKLAEKPLKLDLAISAGKSSKKQIDIFFKLSRSIFVLPVGSNPGMKP